MKKLRNIGAAALVLAAVTTANFATAQIAAPSVADPAPSVTDPPPAGEPGGPVQPGDFQPFVPALFNRLFELNAASQEATNWIFALAPSYAPGLKDETGQKQELGVTGALLYPLSKYVYTGMRFDYLAGDFFLPSVGVTLRAPMKRFLGLPVNTTPFLVTGASYTVSGASSQDNQVGAIFGAGIHFDLYQRKSFGIGVFYEAEKWTQVPDVTIHHGGLTVKWSF